MFRPVAGSQYDDAPGGPRNPHRGRELRADPRPDGDARTQAPRAAHTGGWPLPLDDADGLSQRRRARRPRLVARLVVRPDRRVLLRERPAWLRGGPPAPAGLATAP